MIDNLKIKVFADVAYEKAIRSFSALPHIKGFTTNPSLLKKAGISDYKCFAIKAAEAAGDKSISFEIVSDDEKEIEKEAREISKWGKNVFVKIPFLKTDGSDNTSVIKRAAEYGVKLNITAVFTVDQVRKIASSLGVCSSAAIISIFAGRIADTGVDPKPIIAEAKKIIKGLPNVELLWASPREIFNVIEAQSCGCDIITLTPDLLEKFKFWNMDLNEYSRQTAESFYRDARAAQLKIN